jgi:hypothetical protein
MATTLDSSRVSHRTRGRVMHRLVGAGFAAAAVGNAIGTLPQASSFLQWLADDAWVPPYPWLLRHG